MEQGFPKTDVREGSSVSAMRRCRSPLNTCPSPAIGILGARTYISAAGQSLLTLLRELPAQPTNTGVTVTDDDGVVINVLDVMEENLSETAAE